MALLFQKITSRGGQPEGDQNSSSYHKIRTSDLDFGLSAADSPSIAASSSTSISRSTFNADYGIRKQHAQATITRLLEISRPERTLMIFSAISMIIGSAVSLAVPTFSGRIIDLSIVDAPGADSDHASSPFRLLMSLLGIMTFAGIAGFFRFWWQAQAGHRVVARLRRKLYASILSQDASYFDSVKVGDLISRLSSDADLVQSAVTDQALGLLRNVVVAIGAVALLFYTSISLALLSIAVLPPIAISARLAGRQMKERQKRVRELHAEATSLAEQSLTCIRTVQQYVAESFEAEHYNHAINQAHFEAIENTKLQAVFGSAMQLVVNLALLCVLGFGGLQVQKGLLSPGDLASFVMYSVLMGSNISSISTLYIDLMKAAAAANRVFEIIDRQPTIPPPLIVEPTENEILAITRNNVDASFGRHSITEQESVIKNTKSSALEMIELGGMEVTNSWMATIVVPLSVQFDNVTFSYPSRPESNVLDGFDLSIKAGQVVALVGGSGAGKSTIASLLTRLYDPQVGEIRIDSKAVRDMDPQVVRRNVGIVVQEPLLFPSSIEANIRYGSPNATDEQVREAARLAFVLDFADKFPDGLQTTVGPRGTQLSGGQKQRVAVARCILKNPPIVVFDEATSALDAESESQVQKAIDTACKGRTVIMIAHRLSTIRNADSIIVLRNGRVADIGTFDQLMEDQNGPFRQLMEKQLVQ